MKQEGSSNQNHIENKGLPLVSVIIVTYNAGKYLRECLVSILHQKFKNIELLIFDGASNDNTLEIIKEYDTHITYWQSEPDEGIYDAMNKAIKKATGDWIVFLGADDRLLDGFSSMAESLKNSQTIYYGYCLMNDRQSNREVSEYVLIKCNVCHQAIFYPAVVFRKYGYQADFKVYADHALNIQCWGDKTLKKKYYPYAIANYHLGGISSKTADPAFEKEQLNLIRKHSGTWLYLRYLFKKWKKRKSHK